MCLVHSGRSSALGFYSAMEMLLCLEWLASMVKVTDCNPSEINPLLWIFDCFSHVKVMRSLYDDTGQLTLNIRSMSE
jgi:hypothetical protein